MQIYVVTAVTLFMIFMFLWNKIPFGVTTMTCCMVLVLFGIIDVNTAFSGLINNNTILLAGVLALSDALAKTSLVDKLRGKMATLKDKGGMVLIASLFLITIIISQLMSIVAAVSVMMLFLMSLDEQDEISPSRMIFPILGVSTVWCNKFPIGLGAAYPAMTNTFYQEITNGEYLLGLWDVFKATLIPGIALTIYCLFAWKLIPKRSVDLTKLADVDGVKKAKLTRNQEIITYVVFIAVMITFIFSTKIGEISNITPVIGTLVLIYTKVLSPREAVNSVTHDMVWMVGGILVISSVMSSSGLVQAVGDFIVKMLGSNPNPWLVMFVFAIATLILTTFVTNSGAAAVLTPIAAGTALSAGMNPIPVILIVNVGCWLAIAFPSGSPGAALAFSAGQYSPKDVFKFTSLYLVVATLSLVFGTALLFPLSL